MMTSWKLVMSPVVELATRPLDVVARWDIAPPPTIDWLLRNDRAVVALAAAVTALIWYLVEPIVVTFDTFAYLNAAKFIAGVEGGTFAYFRPPLLPLLLAVTGVPSRQTYFWFILAQLTLGLASVMLMHDTLRRISRSLGLLVTALFMATFMAFVHSKSIMSEQIYLFGWCLCINGALVYLWTGSPLRLIEVTAALLILALTRAQGAFVIAAVLSVLAIGQPRRIPTMAIALLAYLTIVFGYGKLHASMARSMREAEKPTSVSSLGISDSTGKMLFTNVYIDTYKRLGRPAVAPENGPASRRMFEEILAYYSLPGRLTAMMSDQLYGRFEGRPGDLLQTMQRQPNSNYWFQIWAVLDERLGAAESDALLLQVTLEAIVAHPVVMALIYSRNFVVACFRADSPYVWKHQTFGDGWVAPGLLKEMRASGDSSVATPLARVLDVFFPTARLAVLIGAVLVAPFAWRSRWRTSLLLCLSMAVYNQATVALAATPENRYTFYIFPPLLVVITMGLQACADRRASNSAKV